MHGFGRPGQDLAGLQRLLHRLQLALRVDHLGTAQPLGLGLLGDRAHHRLIQVDMLRLDIGHLDAPGVGLRIEDRAEILVELFALGEHLVEF